eukprot:1160524-Pelagomonas_calceolata.AAC.7
MMSFATWLDLDSVFTSFAMNSNLESQSSPNCDLCEADDDVQNEKHVLFHCTHPQVVSLHRKYAPVFSQDLMMCLLAVTLLD